MIESDSEYGDAYGEYVLEIGIGSNKASLIYIRSVMLQERRLPQPVNGDGNHRRHDEEGGDFDGTGRRVCLSSFLPS